METPFPILSDELIKRLGEIYPVVQPQPEDRTEAIFYKAGQRSVINFLIEQHNRQNDRIEV